MNDALVWIDCEMTGLDLENDALIEVACLITDGQLNQLDEGIEVVIKPPQAALDQMGEFVTGMHTDSGLIEELDNGMTMEEAEERVLDHIKRYVPAKTPLCGNSIATDRLFISRDMPRIDSYLHYRMVDVSSIKELLRRWYPRIYFNSPPKHGGHRALADITESIQELRYYRAAAFVAPPGPDTSTVQSIAASFTTAPSTADTAGSPSHGGDN